MPEVLPTTPRAATRPRRPIIPLPDLPIQAPPAEEPAEDPIAVPERPEVPGVPETAPAEPAPAVPAPV